MQLMDRQEGTSDIEFNARFSSAQFRPSPTTVLKGVLNRRVVKESHRDAAYKGIPPTLLPFFFPLSSTFELSRSNISLVRLIAYFPWRVLLVSE